MSGRVSKAIRRRAKGLAEFRHFTKNEVLNVYKKFYVPTFASYVNYNRDLRKR